MEEFKLVKSHQRRRLTMSDYISREAAIEKAEYDGNYRLVIPVEAIKGLPAADVVEVVRCKNCIHRGKEYCSECGKKMERE